MSYQKNGDDWTDIFVLAIVAAVIIKILFYL